MADWILVACLVRLRDEFNRIAPGRDKASDGSKGDDAHEAESSDHNPDETGNVPVHDADHVNEVHAIDVDKDLRESDLTMEKVVQFLLGRCRAGTEKRLRYIIYNRRIWSASLGWVQKPYSGANAHTEHAHFSASYETAHEASTASWHLEDIPVALTDADKTWIEARLDQRAKEDKEDLVELLDKFEVKLTDPVAFAEGGGEGSPVGNGVLNSSYPKVLGADRTLVWVNWQDLQADVTAIKAKLGIPA